MSDIEWLDSALEDVDRFRKDVERFRWGAGDELVLRLFARVESLEDFPNLGRMIPELGVPVLRELIEDPYRILYQVFPDRVEIFAVAHSKQELIRRRESER